MMITVIGIYFAAYIPNVLVSVCGLRSDPSKSELVNMAYIIYYINFWVNPFIYCMQNKDFQMALKKLLNMD